MPHKNKISLFGGLRRQKELGGLGELAPPVGGLGGEAPQRVHEAQNSSPSPPPR